MAFDALEKRSTRLYIRNSIIFIFAALLWLGSGSLACYLSLDDFQFLISLPFFLVAITAIAGLYGFGPLGKDYKQALLEETQDKRETYRVKRPWDPD